MSVNESAIIFLGITNDIFLEMTIYCACLFVVGIFSSLFFLFFVLAHILLSAAAACCVCVCVIVVA